MLTTQNIYKLKDTTHYIGNTAGLIISIHCVAGLVVLNWQYLINLQPRRTAVCVVYVFSLTKLIKNKPIPLIDCSSLNIHHDEK